MQIPESSVFCLQLDCDINTKNTYINRTRKWLGQLVADVNPPMYYVLGIRTPLEQCKEIISLKSSIAIVC